MSHGDRSPEIQMCGGLRSEGPRGRLGATVVGSGGYWLRLLRVRADFFRNDAFVASTDGTAAGAAWEASHRDRFSGARMGVFVMLDDTRDEVRVLRSGLGPHPFAHDEELAVAWRAKAAKIDSGILSL